MIEIRYKEYFEEAELAGNSLAEVRQLYKAELGLPDRAQANLNGEPVSTELEATTILNDNDKLSFEIKSRKRAPAMILGSLLLALSITGALFVYTQTTTTTTINVTGGSTDYATVSANTTDNPDYVLLGSHRGVIPEGSLFDVTLDSNYNGDIAVNVYLTNADELSNDYNFWTMRVNFADSDNVSIDTRGTTQIISLDSPMATFEIQSDNLSALVGYTGYIHCLGGSYRTFGAGWLTAADPLIYAQIVQAGSH